MRRTIYIFATLVFMALIIALGLKKITIEPKQVLKNIQIGDSKLKVELATNLVEWSKGLSNRKYLPKDQGMLFLFLKKETRVFWMKDTLIPLDLLWISDNKVVGIITMQPELDVSSNSLRRYISPVPVDKVLEVNANWASENKVDIGSILKY